MIKTFDRMFIDEQEYHYADIDLRNGDAQIKFPNVNATGPVSIEGIVTYESVPDMWNDPMPYDHCLITAAAVDRLIRYYWTCLIEGTQILLADGTTKNIEDVQPGDLLRSYNPTTKEMTTAVAIRAIKTGEDRGFTNYVFSNGSHLTIYGDHHFYNPLTEEVLPFKIVNPDEIRGCRTFLDSDGKRQFCSLKAGRNYQGDFKRHYNLISSNNLYFANGILCAHNPCDKYNFFVNRQWQNQLTPEAKQLLKASCDAYNEYDGLYENPEYLARTNNDRNRFRHAVQTIRRSRRELDNLDYKCMKHEEGVLSEEEYQEVVARKTELRAIINEQRPIFRESRDAILAVNAEFRLPTRSELFKSCCDLDNAALDQFKDWLCK